MENYKREIERERASSISFIEIYIKFKTKKNRREILESARAVSFEYKDITDSEFL